MAKSIFRQSPGKLRADDLARKTSGDGAYKIAQGFWEYTAPTPPSGGKVIPGISTVYRDTPA